MDRRKLVCTLLVLTLISIGSYAILVKSASAVSDREVCVHSVEDGRATGDLGTITFGTYEIQLETMAPCFGVLGSGPHSISYSPARGYCFVRWEVTEGSATFGDDEDPTTTVLVMDESVAITAIYKACAPSVPSHVGGDVFSANKAVIVAPYFMALISIVAVAAVVVKRRKT